MAATERRTATYETQLLQRIQRLQTSDLHRQALVELTGSEPRSEAALLSRLTGLAVDVVELRALERGYRALAAAEREEYDVASFLERAALGSLDFGDDEDPAPLLAFLSGEDA